MADTLPPPNQTPKPAPPPEPAAEQPAGDQVSLEQARASLGQVRATSPTPPKTETSPPATSPVIASEAKQPRGIATSPSAPRNDGPPAPQPASGAPQRALPRIATPTGSWKLYAGIAGGLIAIGILVYVVVFFPAQLALSTTPEGAVIAIGDQTAAGNLTIRQWPGTVPVAISAPGYVSYADTIRLGAGQKETRTIVLRPLPKPTLLSTQRVQFPVLDEERSSLLYLDPATKTAYRLGITPSRLGEDEAGNPEKPTTDAITPATLESVTDLIWSPNRQLAFLKVGTVTKLYDFKRYDLVTQTVADWPAGIGSIDWRPDGEKVAYYFEPGTGERSLIRATKDNGEVERLYNVADAGITNPELTWSPDAKYLAVRTDTLHLFDVFAKTLTEVPDTAGITAVRWLPTSTALIAETSAGQLLRVNTDATATPLNRVGSLDRLVPLADGSAFIQATSATNGTVTVERVSLTSEDIRAYAADGLTGLTPTNLLLAEDERTLYFTSAGQLYALALDDGTYTQP